MSILLGRDDRILLSGDVVRDGHPVANLPESAVHPGHHGSSGCERLPELIACLRE
jgi:hypothetical protein